MKAFPYPRIIQPNGNELACRPCAGMLIYSSLILRRHSYSFASTIPAPSRVLASPCMQIVSLPPVSFTPVARKTNHTLPFKPLLRRPPHFSLSFMVHFLVCLQSNKSLKGTRLLVMHHLFLCLSPEKSKEASNVRKCYVTFSISVLAVKNTIIIIIAVSIIGINTKHPM